MKRRLLLLWALSLVCANYTDSAIAHNRNLDLADVNISDCDNNERECLYAFIDLYLKALANRDHSILPISDNVKFTQNDEILNLGGGLWRTARSVGGYQLYAADTRTGQAGFMGVIEADDMHTMFTLRLRIVDNRITEIETLVPGKSLANHNLHGFMEAPERLVTARPGFKVDLKPSERTSRDALRRAADSYYDGVEQGSGDIVAFSDKCHRVENGIPLVNNPDYEWPGASSTGRELPKFAAMECREQFNTGIWTTDSITDRRYPLIDEEKGIVFAFVLYHQFSKGQCADVADYGKVCPPQKVKPMTLMLCEAFKIRNGKIHEMESIWPILPDNRKQDKW